MMEAKITCITGSIRLADLNLSLSKGEVIYMAEAKARSSKDLQRAWKAKGVTVQYIERVQMQRAPSNNPVFPPPPSMGGFVTETHGPTPGEQVFFDPDVMAARVAEAVNSDALVANRVRIAVAQRLEGLEDRIVARVVDALKGEIAAGLTVQAVAGQPVAAVGGSLPQPGSVPLVEEVPIFIPSRIKTDDMTAEVRVESRQGDVGGLSDAAAALRAARKGAAGSRNMETDE